MYWYLIYIQLYLYLININGPDLPFVLRVPFPTITMNNEGFAISVLESHHINLLYWSYTILPLHWERRCEKQRETRWTMRQAYTPIKSVSSLVQWASWTSDVHIQTYFRNQDHKSGPESMVGNRSSAIPKSHLTTTPEQPDRDYGYFFYFYSFLWICISISLQEQWSILWNARL